MPDVVILPDPTCLRLLRLTADATSITAHVVSQPLAARCPRCAHASTRIHSHYVRRVADLPWHGVAMRLDLHVRRFFCLAAECPRQIFVERLPSIVAPYARRTLRLTDLARSGWELHQIAQFAGHRNPQTTLLYIHLSGHDLAERLTRGMSHIHAWRIQTLARAFAGEPVAVSAGDSLGAP
jgi:zinc-finger of transposase IS204/IS1001/IS1096/IS1165